MNSPGNMVHVQDAEVRKAIGSVASTLGPTGVATLLLRWGVAVKTAAMKAAMAKGGRKLWRQIARSVEVRGVSADGVSVTASHPAAAQKQFGGPIEAPGKGPWAKGSGALTIPLPGSRAEGRTASEFGELQMIKRTGGRPPLLVQMRGKQTDFLFVLIKRTKPQRPDPWWPEPEAVNRMGLLTANRMLEAAS